MEAAEVVGIAPRRVGFVLIDLQRLLNSRGAGAVPVFGMRQIFAASLGQSSNGNETPI